MFKRIRPPFRIQSRRLSTPSSPYNNFTKLRAFPFKVLPEDAQKFAAPFAAVACNFRKTLPSIGAFLAPFANFDYLRPVRFSAVYFPIWLVNGEVEAIVTYKGIEGKESAWFENTYIPGSDMAVLSAAPLRYPDIGHIDTVPFTDFLMQQHGEPVHCIPFSTSPFSVLDITRSYSPSFSIMINEDLSINLSSVKTNLVTAYPVLLPLYLAQYEIQGGTDPDNNMLTFLLSAHSPLPSIMCENLSRINEASRRAIEMSSEIFGAESSDEIYTFPPVSSRVSIPDVSMSPRGSISNSIQEWLEELLSSSSNIETLADSSLDVIGNGDKDLRIREMLAEDKLSMMEYTELTVSVMFAKRFIKTWKAQGEKPPVKIIHFLPGQELEKELDEKELNELPQKVIGEKLERLEAQRAESAPKWWFEWLSLNRPESEFKSGEESAGTTTPPKDKP